MTEKALTAIAPALQEVARDKRLAGLYTNRRADKDLTFARECLYLSERVAQDDKLARCTPESFGQVLLQAAATGLSLAPIRAHLYVYPYGNQATLSIGYRGMEHLVHKSKTVKFIQSGVVYEDDPEFREWTDETGAHFVHREARTHKKGAQVTHSYCLAVYANGGHHLEVCTADDLEAAYKAATARNTKGGAVWKGPWVNEMRKKVAVRRAWKHWPYDAPLGAAMQVMDEVEPMDPIDVTPRIGPKGAQELHGWLIDQGVDDDALASRWLARQADRYGVNNIEELPEHDLEACKTELLAQVELRRENLPQ